jgi:peptidoglycan/LPS O-acetylase OafA/YrhL
MPPRQIDRETAPDFSRRIPQLDGLRGVAIAIVVIFHYVNAAFAAGAPRFVAVLLRPTSLGWSGVDLFFILSGFLIGGILIDARESGNYFLVFYRRRLCRIFPLYFAFLAIAFFAIHFKPSPLHVVYQPAIPWKVCAIFCQNFWMAIHNDMGAVMNPTWSLAVEEQFYLVIPAVIYFVRPSRLIWILTAGIVLAPLIRLTIFLANPRLTMAMYVLLPCRMDSLLLGVATAYFLRQPGAWEFVGAHLRQLWIAIELLTVVCALFLVRASMFDPLTMLLGYDCVGVLYACILVASLFDRTLARVLQARWLMGLGSIAYGVYLIHLLAFGLIFAVLKDHPNSGATTAIIALVLTIVIAKVSWEWFEKPFVRFGRRECFSPSTSLVGQSPDVAGFAIPTQH